MKHEYNLPRSQLEILIDEWIFNIRDRSILKERLLDGLTYDRIAERHDMSTTQIKRIVYKSENILFDRISN